MSRASRAYAALSRKKIFDESNGSQLAKVLTTLDLTALGVGSTLGVGIYVLAGEVSKLHAGPAVVISFAIAAIASVMAGLCYAEFGSRVPRAGSAYIYSYVTIGECIAFIIGWNLIMEYAIGCASVAKALSTYLDALFNQAMQKFFLEHFPMHQPGLSSYVDLCSLAITLAFSIALIFGAKESTILNNIFTMVNLCVVLFVIVSGCFLADASNWAIPASSVPPNSGEGGFAPFGLAGIIRGAAVCFYGFIGFDVIATAGEETRNPRRSIPISIIVSLSIIFAAYFTLSTVLTMAIPYFEQDEKAPIVYMFSRYNWYVPRYIVSVGAIFGLAASLMGSMFPLPRVIYAMSIDGLVFRFLGTIHPRLKTPVWGTLTAGIITGTLTAIFNLGQLVNMMSIGTLLAYSMVAACVLLLRYEYQPELENSGELEAAASAGIVCRLFNLRRWQTASRASDRIVTLAVTLYCVWCASFSAIISLLEAEVLAGVWYAVLSLTIAGLLIVFTLVVVARQPRSIRETSFAAPFSPWLPGLSILINVYLMFQLDVMTWMRYGVWILIGLCVYFGYGIWNSDERPSVRDSRRKQELTENVTGRRSAPTGEPLSNSQESLVTHQKVNG